ncbi:hypothetical protein, partial [Pseudomonas sp. MD330_10]|uniref:hypothetical protein n=1 Tax=Pseudomonas sp. MD330_10 TaxID=3241254 RepID=UPI0036D3DD0D
QLAKLSIFPCPSVKFATCYAAKTKFSYCKKRSNTRLFIGFEDFGVLNAPLRQPVTSRRGESALG